MRSGRSSLRWIGVFLLALALVSAVPAGPVRAATIVVDAAGDGAANAANCPAAPAGTCRLRDAVAKSGNGDVISIKSGLGTIHITHAAGTIMISHDLTIAGAGANTTIIDAQQDTQPFTIAGPNTASTGVPIAASVTFHDLTIQNINLTYGSSTIGGAVLVESTGTLTLTNVKFLNNSNANGGAYGGGAVMLNIQLRPPLITDPLLSAPLVITNCTFTGNQTDFGGGAIQWNGPITISNSTFTNNIANGGGTGADGGAILDSLIDSADRPSVPATGIVTVSNSTFTGNQQVNGSGGAISSNAIHATNVTFTGNQTTNGWGGAVEVHLYPSTGTPPLSTIVNATFDGNSAGSADSVSGAGGAIYVGNGSLTLLNATITNNSVGVLGGGVSLGSGSITFGNNIIAGNTSAISSPDVGDPIVSSLGHNLIGTSTGSAGWVASDKTGGPGGNTNPPNLLDPRLNPLGNNSGTTQTRLPLPGSPALDAGDDTICNQTGPGTVNKLDQRGVARPIGLHCDIGATEGTGGKIVPAAGTTPQQTAIGTAFATALAATVQDPNGNPLGSGISVTFTVVPVGGAGGSFPANAATATASTDVNGVATAPAFTANTVLGAYTVTANLTLGPLGTPATFALTNTAGAPNSITANAGTTPQSTTVGTAFGIPLAATVFDASHNHVGSGISVTFTVVPVGGAGAAFPGNVPTAAVNTDVNGVATAPTLIANTAPGAYTVTANLTVGPLDLPATFALTNIGAGTTTTAQDATAPFSTTAQSVTLTAMVTSTAGTVNAGTVTFTVLQGATPIGSPVTSSALTTGAASVSYALPANTPAATYTIQAVYNAGGGFATSQDNTHTLTVSAATLTSIAVGAPGSVDGALTLKVGQTVMLTATGVYGDHSTQPLPAGQLQLHSADTTKVTVDANGNLTGQSPGGPVNATVTQGGVTGTIKVTVVPLTPIGITVPPAPASRPSGATSGTTGGQSPAPAPVPNVVPSSGPAPSSAPGGR